MVRFNTVHMQALPLSEPPLAEFYAAFHELPGRVAASDNQVTFPLEGEQVLSGRIWGPFRSYGGPQWSGCGGRRLLVRHLDPVGLPRPITSAIDKLRPPQADSPRKRLPMTRHVFDNDFAATREHREQFARDGFVKLPGFLNANAVRMLLDRVDGDPTGGTDAFKVDRAGLYKRALYDFGEAKTNIFELLERPYFRQALTDLTGCDLFLTQENSFEIEKNVHRAAPWHVGVQSFGYQCAEEFGCTIWAPLHPIDANGQRGGMTYVSEEILSGDFAYAVDLAFVEAIRARHRAGKPTTPADYYELRTGPLNAPAMSELLEANETEDDFVPGDVLLFNKNVIHRGRMLGEGELDRRAAYVMRFVGADSRYDLSRARTLEFPTEQYPSVAKPVTRLHIEIAEAGAEHGDLLAECAYFDDRERRTIRRPGAGRG
ncbi:MAG: hypothetical protein OYK82_00430 [Gammaproteobacteria bacterium]|nr:hypothetical protein [Gammaproteobacteria bacterium]